MSSSHFMILKQMETQLSSLVVQQYQNNDDNVPQTEIYESVGRDIDYDQRNEENVQQLYNRYGSSNNTGLQQSQTNPSEEIEAKKAISTFEEIGDKNMEARASWNKSKQALIAARLLRVRREIGNLQKELSVQPEQS